MKFPCEMVPFEVTFVHFQNEVNFKESNIPVADRQLVGRTIASRSSQITVDTKSSGSSLKGDSGLPTGYSIYNIYDYTSKTSVCIYTYIRIHYTYMYLIM